MLKAGVGTNHRGVLHRLPASTAAEWPPPRLLLQATSEKEIGLLVHLGLSQILNEVLSVVSAEQVLSGHQWLFSLEPSRNICNGVHQTVLLQSSCWQHIVLPPG